MRTLILALATALTLLPTQDPPKAEAKADVGNGRVAWFDITTTDMTKSKAFYAGLFGWTWKSMPGYEKFAAEIVVEGQSIGTLRVAEGAISGFNGVVYVQVADIQASCAKAKELGAAVVEGFPFDLDDGRGAVGLVLDPAGHPLGMYSRTPIATETPAR